MSDYIKRDDAKGIIHYFFLGDDPFIVGGAEVRKLTNKEKCDEALKYIEHLSTADVAPVRHGKWIDKSGGIEGAWNCCSVCGERAIELYDYCPNCGAKMDEGKDNA